MSRRGHGQIRRGQVITTYGPGALIDLPSHSAIVAGLDTWSKDLEEITEPRLARKLGHLTGVSSPRLVVPPPDDAPPGAPPKGIGAWLFPEWFVVQDPSPGGGKSQTRSRRLVPKRLLDDRGRYEGSKVVATRFVRACPRGHVSDLDWWLFVHGKEDPCRRQLWLDERGTSGDLGDLFVRCECGKSRGLYEAAQIDMKALGTCSGKQPWLGRTSREDCSHPARLLIRTASNAYFAQVVSTLSLPERGTKVEAAVQELWEDLGLVEEPAQLRFLMKKVRVAEKLAPFEEQEVLDAITSIKDGPATERPVKQVELDALLAAPDGFGDDVPVDHDFHARRLPDHVWRRSERSDAIEAVIQLHRLREVRALVGFTRFEAVTPDVNGEYTDDITPATIALEPRDFPAVENRGEGIFLSLRASAVSGWLTRDPVEKRLDALRAGHVEWQQKHRIQKDFPGGPYVLLHTLSHLLIQSLSMRCGYPASSLRERVYVDPDGGRYGLLLYTGSPDAEGTLGGLVQQARHLEEHLVQAIRTSALCSNDPICAQHRPGESLEERWLHGASCHGCTLVAETSCEMRNEFLDRALVAPVLGVEKAAFFEAVP